MVKREKLEARIRNNPRNISLKDFEALINMYGQMNRGNKPGLQVAINILRCLTTITPA